MRCVKIARGFIFFSREREREGVVHTTNDDGRDVHGAEYYMYYYYCYRYIYIYIVTVVKKKKKSTDNIKKKKKKKHKPSARAYNTRAVFTSILMIPFFFFFL